MQYKKIIYYLLILLLITDLTYSFIQHLSMPLDGDMAGGIVPSNEVKPVLKDPFGISVITKSAVYPNPNRFFAHWAFYNYFNYFPIWLQSVVSPIESPYLACAIAKILIQISLIILLYFYITGDRKILNKNFIIVAIIITPLFQTNGYRSYMGIIDPSTTYTFFYALPCTLLLLFYLPFYRCSYNNIEFTKNKFLIIFLMFLSIFITLNGPLVPGVILIITLLLGLNFFRQPFFSDKNNSFLKKIMLVISRIPKPHLFFFTLISLLSLYSIYIGLNNAIFIGNNTTLLERYSRIFIGIYLIITQKMAYPVLLLAIAINIFLTKKYFQNFATKRFLGFFKWIGLFSLLYILLLPLGGYKEYRPNVLRYDTIMPITIALIYIYGFSTYLLIKNFVGKQKKLYFILIIAVSLIYTFADEPGFEKNKCERLALKKIAVSQDTIVYLGTDCNILSWQKIIDPNNSEINSQLLNKWRIINNKKLYYQKN